MTIDATVPGDDDIVSQYPPLERAMRQALLNDHDANGRHEQLTMVDMTASPPPGLASHLTVWQEGGVLKQRNGTGAVVTLGITPVGGIILWSGTLLDIPAGWQLCDGSNGTPDLRNRFVLGAGPSGFGFPPGTNGGSDTHAHGGATGNHALTVAQMPPHQHGGIVRFSANFNVGNAGSATNPPIRSLNLNQVTDAAGSGQAHNHTITAANHLPPYYVLAYIMFTG